MKDGYKGSYRAGLVLEIIEWADHWTARGWRELDAIEKGPLLVRSVGWCIRDDHETVTLAPTEAESSSGKVADATVIFKTAIVNRWEIGEL